MIPGSLANSSDCSKYIIIVSRAWRPPARRVLSQPDSRQPAIYHGPARGVQLWLDRGRAGQDCVDHVEPTGAWGPSGSLPAERARVEVQDSPRRMVQWQAKHMSISADPAAGNKKVGLGLSSKGPHRFIGNEVTPVNAKNRSESPTVKAIKPGGEGSSEQPSLRAVQQHRQDCSIVYAHLGGTRNGLLAPQNIYIIFVLSQIYGPYHKGNCIPQDYKND